MKATNIFNDWIAVDYATAIINDDYSCLEFDEMLQIKKYLEDGYLTIVEDEEEFRMCGISRLLSDCVYIQIIY